MIVWRWRRGAEPARRALLAICAAAMPVGLLLLGLVFDNTPIELRYLAFATPFIGLLLATLPRSVCGVVLAIQAASIAGLMMRPETMQPARATAMAAAALVGDGVVLVPRGNDGVGIVGAFAIEAPPGLHMLVIGRDESAGADPRARQPVSARGARAVGSGCRQPCDAASDARGVRGTVLARGGRSGRRARVRADMWEE